MSIEQLKNLTAAREIVDSAREEIMKILSETKASRNDKRNVELLLEEVATRTAKAILER